MSVRSLRNWEEAAGRAAVRLGRPPHAPAARAAAEEEVAEASRALGHTAGRRVLEAVVAMPRRLLEPALKMAKAFQRAHQRAVRGAARIRRVVHTRETIVGEDGAHLGSTGGRGVWSEVYRDWATLALQTAGTGGPVTEHAAIEGLETLQANGRLPLVWATDNGPGYRPDGVGAWLVAHEVVHLRNRCHTPQDNAATERAVGEAKAEAGVGRGTPLASAEEGLARLDAACVRLNGRPRASREGRTAEGLTHALPSWETRVMRSEFFAACQGAIQRATGEGLGARARRTAEREAIFQTLERFGLMSRTRGGRPLTAFKPEMIS